MILFGMANPYRIRVHSLAHARAALMAAREAGRIVILDSPAGAAGWHGIGWWRRLVRALAEEFGDVATVLDCGDAPGHALAALRAGCRGIRLRAAAATLSRVGGIAAALGATVEDAPPTGVLDLQEATDPLAACARHLGA